jgi:hypothetical protein
MRGSHGLTNHLFNIFRFMEKNTPIDILKTLNTPTLPQTTSPSTTLKLPLQSKQKPKNKAKSSSKSAGSLLRKNSTRTDIHYSATSEEK